MTAPNFGTAVPAAGGVVVENRSPSAAPIPKVISYALGGTAGAPLAALLIWLLEEYALHRDMPELAEGGIYWLVMVGVGFIAAYQTPPQGFGGSGSTVVRTIGLAFVLFAGLSACSALPWQRDRYDTPQTAEKARFVNACAAWSNLDPILIVRSQTMQREALDRYERQAKLADQVCLKDLPAGNVTGAALDQLEAAVIEMQLLAGR